MRLVRLSSFAACAWVALAILGPACLHAGIVYVPALSFGGNQGTEVVLFNDGSKAITYRYAVNGGIGPANGPTGTIGVRGYAVIAIGSQTGVVAVDVPDSVHVGAWLRTRVSATKNFFSGMSRVYDGAGTKANTDIRIYHMHRGDLGQLHVLNMGKAPASCTAKSSLINETFAVPAGELGVLEAVATARLDEALVVRCNQMFHAFGLVDDEGRRRLSNPAESPPNEPAGIDDQNFFDDAHISFEWLGMFHQPSATCNSGPKKGFLVFYLDRAEAVVRSRLRMDQKLGTWFSKNKGGIHNFFWIHRNIPNQPFKENNLGNANALGTGKNRFRVNQNIDLPKGQATRADGGYKWTTKQRYLVAYDHDPVNKIMRLELSQDGNVLSSLKDKATGFNKQVTLAQSGVLAEFGNRCGDPPPEVPGNSDWYAHDLKFGMFTKQSASKN